MNCSFYGRKRVFLTGNTGFKGTWLTHILLYLGAHITGYALKPPTEPSLFEQTGVLKDIHYIEGDIRDRDKLIKTIKEAKADIVFHLAAQPIVRVSYKEPAYTYETNVMGTVNILEAIRACDSVRSIVNITTDKVYENKEWFWGYRENENLCGSDPYSNSKSCSELVTHCYRNSFFIDDQIRVSTVRSGNVIGGGDYSVDRIIPDCIRYTTRNETIIVRNPCSIRPYVNVFDSLHGYLLVAEKQWLDKKYIGTYNFGPNDDGYVGTGHLVDLFCDKWGNGASWTVENNGTQPHEDNYLKLDCSKAHAVLDWKPKWNIEQGMDKIIEYAKLNTNEDRRKCIEVQIKEYIEL